MSRPGAGSALLPMMYHTTLATAVAALGLAACTESGTLRLDGQIARTSQALGVGTPAQSLTLGEGTLEITRARIAVSEIELEGGKDDEREAEMGAAVIELNLTGEPTTFAVSEVEAGSYHTLGLEFTRRDFDGVNASVVIDGTYQGSEFTLSSGWAPEAEFPLQPHVEVPANGEATAGVTFDVASWFVDDNGAVIDPTSSSSQKAIEQRFIDSISAAAAIEAEGTDDDD